jgi:hypothetical protein
MRLAKVSRVFPMTQGVGECDEIHYIVTHQAGAANESWHLLLANCTASVIAVTRLAGQSRIAAR